MGRKRNFRGSSPEFVLQTFKTQNDARGARPHPPVRSSHCGLQKPEIAYSPNGLKGQRRRPRLQPVLSCCRPDMGRQTWRFEGQVIESPHISVFNPLQGIPFAGRAEGRNPLPFVMAGLCPGPPPLYDQVPGSRFACPGIDLKPASLTSNRPWRQPSRAGP